MREPPTTPFKAPTNATSLIVQSGILGACFALAYLIGDARGWATGMSIGAIAILIELSWPLRRESWFWFGVVVFAAIHVWAVLSLNWSWILSSERHTLELKGLILLFWLDLGAMSAVTYGAYRLKYGKPPQVVEPSLDELPRYGDHDMNW